MAKYKNYTMKKFISISLKVLLVATLLTMYTGCKKDNDQDNSTFSPGELAGYQWLLFINNGTGTEMRLVHFTQSGNDVTATIESVTLKKSQSLSLRNDGFSIDEKGDGISVFHFKLKKDANGEPVINMVEYKDRQNPAKTIQSVHYITKSSEIIPFQNNSYEGPGFLQFNAGTWRYYAVPNAMGNYTEIAPGAWKGTLNGAQYMGVSAKINNRWRMFLQKAGEPSMMFSVI
ncbi:MAG: hypothetical protein BGO56_00850 [Sphingobacteriales bacterium 48-107]|nr:MAG: hypothetical protein BGO56_00850 [Sphingobacteriales bacterium 48-107]